MHRFFRWCNRNQAAGLLLMRLFAGTRLIYGVQDNILHRDRMVEFAHFLNSFNFPFPTIAAVVSVYAQLVAGLMFVFGWRIRWAALIMIINFLVAILTVHLGQTFEQMTPALAMLFISILFLFLGSGRYSLDREPDSRRTFQ